MRDASSFDAFTWEGEIFPKCKWTPKRKKTQSLHLWIVLLSLIDYCSWCNWIVLVPGARDESDFNARFKTICSLEPRARRGGVISKLIFVLCVNYTKRLLNDYIATRHNHYIEIDGKYVSMAVKWRKYRRVYFLFRWRCLYFILCSTMFLALFE